MTRDDAAAGKPGPFSEKGFYLSEFRDRTLALALPGGQTSASAPLESVLKELESNRTRVVLLYPGPEAPVPLPGPQLVARAEACLEGAAWRALRAAQRVGVALPGGGAFAPACRAAVLRLGIQKLVWIDPGGGLLRADGSRQSFVDLEELRALIRGGPSREAPTRRALLGEVEAALEAGVAAVNLCALDGLADELFTYAGSGTLFTRERYVAVRRLGLDDYDAAHDLIARGVGEGYLAPRSAREIERVLANGFGAFVEDRHLAGIGALLLHPEESAGEIASLYTLTRFLGEGIGAYLVGFAVERARELGCSHVFACTTAERVLGFFERQGFRRVGSEEIPEGKWRDYDARRRSSVRCLRREID